MWAQARPLKRVSFVQRCMNPGVPLVWCALFVQDTTGGFLSREWGGASVVAYVMLVAWHGSLQELSAHTGRRRADSLREVREWGLRGVNTLADVGATLTFLFFLLRWFPAAWFAPLLFVTLTCHVAVEVVVARRLQQLHSCPKYWGGRVLAKPRTDALTHVYFATDQEEESAQDNA